MTDVKKKLTINMLKSKRCNTCIHRWWIPAARGNYIHGLKLTRRNEGQCCKMPKEKTCELWEEMQDY